MELPNYRMPGLKNVVRLLWEKAKDFLERAFTVILLATIVIWFLQHFDLRFNMTDDPHASILATVSGLLVPIMSPVGLGDWRICTSLITGFIAKESVVATMEILFPPGLEGVMSTLSGLCILVFSLIYTPCVAAIAAVRRELGSKWAVGIVLIQCAVAWVVTLIVHLIGSVII